MIVSIVVNTANAAAFMQRLERDLPSFANDSLGKAALRAQAEMRQQQEVLIYQTPESPMYRRTRTLFRSTHAAKYGKDHSGDHARAFTGADLAATSPRDVVEQQGNRFISQVGSWADWSELVEYGIRQGARGPRPYGARTAAKAPTFMMDEIGRAVAGWIARNVR